MELIKGMCTFAPPKRKEEKKAVGHTFILKGFKEGGRQSQRKRILLDRLTKINKDVH